MATIAIPDTRQPVNLAALRRGHYPLAWRTLLLSAGVLWLATRLLAVLLTLATVSGDRLAIWDFYDARFYVGIAQTGYPPAHPANASFFPLYPLLIHLAGGSPLAALVIANLATLAALVAIGALVTHETRSTHTGVLAQALLAAAPLGVFLAGAYTDGLLIALVASALLAARREHWGWAALAGALAIVTRPFGVLVPLALLLEYAARYGWWRGLALRRLGVVLRELGALVAAPCITFGAFLVVLWRTYGDPLMFLHAEGIPAPGTLRWGRGFRWPWQTLGLVWTQLRAQPLMTWETAHLLLDTLPVLLCLLVALLALRRGAPVAFSALSLGVVAICLTSPTVLPHAPDPLVSAGRYCYAAVPVLIPLAAWVSRLPRALVALSLLSSLALQGALIVFLLHGGWLV